MRGLYENNLRFWVRRSHFDPYNWLEAWSQAYWLMCQSRGELWIVSPGVQVWVVIAPNRNTCLRQSYWWKIADNHCTCENVDVSRPLAYYAIRCRSQLGQKGSQRLRYHRGRSHSFCTWRICSLCRTSLFCNRSVGTVRNVHQMVRGERWLSRLDRRTGASPGFVCSGTHDSHQHTGPQLSSNKHVHFLLARWGYHRQSN